jgi:3-hydroxyacyl-[acyl-carrier-protein] dehydratase
MVFASGNIKCADNQISAQVILEHHSPWFSGHFPRNPILPGIAQLKMVMGVIAAARQDNSKITGLSRIKFRKIVRPGAILDILASHNSNDQYAFRITSNNEEVCSGMISVAQKDNLASPGAPSINRIV